MIIPYMYVHKFMNINIICGYKNIMEGPVL